MTKSKKMKEDVRVPDDITIQVKKNATQIHHVSYNRAYLDQKNCKQLLLPKVSRVMTKWWNICTDPCTSNE